MSRIFISYKRIDKKRVFRIKKKIESAVKESCWIDLDGIESDAQFVSVIMHAINAAEIVLFMYSAAHGDICDYENDWTVKELNFAKSKGKRIVLINIDGSHLTDWFEFHFGLMQQVDARSAESMMHLILDLRRWLHIAGTECNTYDEPDLAKWYSGFFAYGRAMQVAYNTCKGASVKRLKRLNTDIRLKWLLIYNFLKKKKQFFSMRFVCLLSSALIPLGFWICNNFKCGEQEVSIDTLQIDSLQLKRSIELQRLSENMVYVEGGNFEMGATEEQGKDANYNEKPVCSCSVHGFYMSKYEVTQALWKAVMDSVNSSFQGDSLPVENVSRDECLDFITRLNNMTGLSYRLPTEMEWEYAARGGQKAMHHKYPGSANENEVAWFVGNSERQTHPVGLKKPNELGLYDMAGNVWEWCSNQFAKYSEKPYSSSGYVYRGGCWFSPADYCRTTKRNADKSSFRSNGLGLRLSIDKSEFEKRNKEK